MKHHIGIIVVLSLASAIMGTEVLSAAGQSSSFGSRVVLSLDRGWSFHKGDFKPAPIRGHSASYHNAKAGNASGAAAPDYDDHAWRVVDLPHDWAIEGVVDSTANVSQGYYERGWGWYRRKFRLDPEDKGKHIELQFDGIATYATIWVNGTLVHRNWCGYTSMYIDMTPYVTYGDNLNTIAVRVDAESSEGWWYEGAGIYRHTWLVKRSPMHITTDGIFANPVREADGVWNLPAEVELYNSGKQTAGCEVELTLYSPDGVVVASSRTGAQVTALRKAVVSTEMKVNNPQLWSPCAPALYRLHTALYHDGKLTDETDTRCGFRTISFDNDSGFWLNDENIKIKGVCIHQDHAGVGVAVPDALLRFRLRKLKEMGVNAIRCTHNPMAKELMALCDSLGIMVMDENRVFNASPEYVRQLEWLLRRDRNNPSVIMWSVFNEEPMQGSENGCEMVRRMRDVVTCFDTTRPVTAAMNGGFFAPCNVSQAVDVAGFNYQIDNYERFHALNPGLPLISSEDGSAFMVRGEYHTDMSRNIIDEYDSCAAGWGATHRRDWKAVNERPWMAGCFYWTGFDYHGEPTPFEWPSVSSFFGIMDLCGFPKSAFWLRQAQWRNDIEVMEMIPHWSFPADSLGKAIKVMTFSNADKVRLYLNGKLIGEQTVDPYEMNTWTVNYRPGRLDAVGYRNGKVVSHKRIETVGTPDRMNLVPDRDFLLGDGEDAMPVTVEVLDKMGRHVPTACDMAEFSVSGPIRIIGFGNGNPNCHEPEKGGRRSLFNGLAQLIIQSTGEEGEATISVSAEGMKPHTLVVPVRKAGPRPFVAVEKAPAMLTNWMLSPLYAERPDVCMEIPDSDMNSWQPVTIGVGRSTHLANSRYVIYRTVFAPPVDYRRSGGAIVFKKMFGRAEVWLNGQLLGKKNIVEEADFKVELPPREEACDLRVLCYGEENSYAGLRGNVNIQIK